MVLLFSLIIGTLNVCTNLISNVNSIEVIFNINVIDPPVNNIDSFLSSLNNYLT